MTAIKNLISSKIAQSSYRQNCYGGGLKGRNDCFRKQFCKGKKILISKGFLKHLTVKTNGKNSERRFDRSSAKTHESPVA